MVSDGVTRSQLQARLLVVRVCLSSRPVGKSAGVTELRPQSASSDNEVLWGGSSRKPSKLMAILTVPQTDTGRQVEDTKVFERTIVKELGKLTP